MRTDWSRWGRRHSADPTVSDDGLQGGNDGPPTGEDDDELFLGSSADVERLLDALELVFREDRNTHLEW